MSVLRVVLEIFVFVVVVCPVIDVTCEGLGKVNRFGVPKEDAHIHKQQKPCAVCPRQGQCVPRVQCPAVMRPGSLNPVCHLEGKQLGVCCFTGSEHAAHFHKQQRPCVVSAQGPAPKVMRLGSQNPVCHLEGKQLGVCCFTGSEHAAESDRKFRSASSTSPSDVKVAHKQSRKKLQEWLSRSEQLVAKKNTIVDTTSPYFAHHLSVMTTDRRAEKLAHGGLLNLFAAQELKARQALSDDELALALTGHTDGPFCPPAPTCPNPPSRYRSFGGECNNPKSPTWGAVHTGFERLLPPDYSDGTWAMRVSSSGTPLPSPRVVSNALILDVSHPSRTHNLMFMQFGQFIAHDTSAGTVFTIGNGSAISCCSPNGEDFLPPESQHWACAPIPSGPADDFYGQFNHQCHNFVRAQLAPAPDCSVGYAKQMNGATHFPDLSHLYGSADEKISMLRGPGGLLSTFNDYGRELPPLTERKECLSAREGAACFESGDSHGNQIISLTVLHTLWTREHNRIARALTRLNPDWEPDRVYLEARRIAQAEFQHILYSEWLPLLLGPELVQTFGLSPSLGYCTSYDPLVNPSLTAEFSTAAMRFGHSVVDGKMTIPNVKSGSVYESVSIPEVMFQPSRLRLRPFLDRLITGLSFQPMQNVDPFVTEGLTRYLFHGGNPFGIDLAAINIQRGRDYGVRAYNHYRRLVGLQPIGSFGQFTPIAAQRLASVYESPDDIDLWVGGLLEEPAEGSVVGLTFAHILADQFSRTKRGDRYFYKNGPDVNPGAFSPGQLSEIKKVTLSRIICDNRDGIELFAQPPNAFVRADLPGNEPVPCDSLAIPTMDLSRFKEI